MAHGDPRKPSILMGALLLVPLLVAALALGAPAAAAAADDDPEEFTTAEFLAPTDGSLVTFDPSTLFGALVNHTVVVAFTVEWCALCTGYAPEFARVAAAFADANATDDGLRSPGDDDDDPARETSRRQQPRRRRRSRHPDPGSSSHKKLVFGTVDAETHKRLAATFGVTNAPYVALLRNDDWYDRATGVPHSPATRFGGYLAFAPTVEWLNAHLGTDVHAKPIVADLTTETIDAYVADPNADVLVEFYAPWCGHCKQFAPFYHEIGAHFSADQGEDREVGRGRAPRHGGVVRRHRAPFPAAVPARVQAARPALSGFRADAREDNLLRQVAAGVPGGGDGDGHAGVGLRAVAGEPRGAGAR